MVSSYSIYNETLHNYTVHSPIYIFAYKLNFIVNNIFIH